MNDRYLGHSDVEKKLGVKILRSLAWSCHAKRRAGKGSQATQMIKWNISGNTN